MGGGDKLYFEVRGHRAECDESTYLLVQCSISSSPNGAYTRTSDLQV